MSQCSTCLQMLWANTRYIGCSYDACPSVSGYQSVLPMLAMDDLLVVCHFYVGADVSMHTLPYLPGVPCTACPVDRDTCVTDVFPANLCTGCPADNWERCTVCASVAVCDHV